MNSIFSYVEYKKYLDDLSEHSSIRGFRSRLAEAGQCQRAYFSRVMNTEIHLTPEQAYGITEFLGLSEAEASHFLDLVSFARAGTPKLRASLKRKIEKNRVEHEDLKNRYSMTQISDSAKEGLYYSSWHWAAIHLATGIPSLQTSAQIAGHLNLPEMTVEGTLRSLEQMKLVKKKKDRWVFDSADLHLPRHSVMTTMNHAHWRHQALMDSQKGKVENVHYSVVHTHSEEDFEKLRQLVISFIDSTRKVVGPSKNEMMSVICLDSFRV